MHGMQREAFNKVGVNTTMLVALMPLAIKLFTQFSVAFTVILIIFTHTFSKIKIFTFYHLTIY